MNFTNVRDFLAMRSQDGVHFDGLYVWLAYGVTLLVIVYNVVAPVLRQRRFIRAEAQRRRRTAVEKAVNELGSQAASATAGDLEIRQ